MKKSIHYRLQKVFKKSKRRIKMGKKRGMGIFSKEERAK